jgi:tRNA A-37 threonylcarbamoyl transferase component Bud32
MFWIKDFKGHSGCKVQLYSCDNKYIVVKSGSSKLKESANILLSLQNEGFNIPEIYYISDDKIHMQYLNGIDMKTYIHNANSDEINNLINFIDSYIERSLQFKSSPIMPNIVKKLKDIESRTDLTQLMFTTSELIKKLPSSGKVGLVHGDFTLENILFYNNKFYFIDANPTDINAIEFDVNKIRQDLECLWFVRNESDIITYKIVCDKINFHLKNKWEFMNNNYILILMLLRILPYCTEDTTQNFLIKEINKLWQ